MISSYSSITVSVQNILKKARKMICVFHLQMAWLIHNTKIKKILLNDFLNRENTLGELMTLSISS